MITVTTKPKKYKHYYATTMSMEDFVRNNFSYFEQRFVEDYPFKFVGDADLVEVFAKEIREIMIDLYADHLE